MALTQQQCDDLDSRASIQLVAVNLLVKEPKLFHASLARAAHQVSAGTTVQLFGAERDAKGWLEFGIHVTYGGGGQLFIGCIQRTSDAEPEFHS